MSNATTPSAADLDTTETHDGITWIWFGAMEHGRRVSVIGLRIAEGRATICINRRCTDARNLVSFGQAWTRCLAWVQAHPSLALSK